MKNNIQHEDYYQTCDLALAATISLFYPIEKIEKYNPRKSQFLFKRNEELNKLIQNYWRGSLRVEPQSYFNQLKLIKTRLYGEL